MQRLKREKSLGEKIDMYYKAMLASYLGIFVIIGPIAIIPFLIFMFITILDSLILRREIRRSNGLINDNGYAYAGIAVPLLLFVLLAASAVAILFVFSRVEFLMNSYNIDRVSNVLSEYANNHNGKYPASDKWADILVEYSKDNDDDIDWAIGYEDKDCMYAINPVAAKLGSDAPEDMVLIFETKSGWNQAGGIELMLENENELVRFQTCGYDSKIVRKSRAQYLKWTLEAKKLPPKSNKLEYGLVLGSICLLTFGYILVKYGRYLLKYWLLVLLLAVLAAGFGGFMGMSSEEFLYQVRANMNCGWIIGGIAGAMGAVCYVALLGRRAERWTPDFSLLGYATMLGIAVGVICSCITHGFLMIAYEELILVNLVAGLAFGAFGGISLGWLSSWCVTLSCKKRLGEAVCCEDCKIQEVGNSDF